jgi:hypothetical protein
MFISALYTLAKLWYQNPDGPQVINGLRKCDIDGVLFKITGTEHHHVKWRNSGSRGQRLHFFPHNVEVYLKEKCVHKYIHDHICIFYRETDIVITYRMYHPIIEGGGR